MIKAPRLHSASKTRQGEEGCAGRRDELQTSDLLQLSLPIRLEKLSGLLNNHILETSPGHI